MSDELKKQSFTLEDGRKAERIVQGAGQDGKSVTEIWVEPAVEKRLSQRVVEYSKPVIHRREVEVVDENSGEVVERKIESIEPEIKMQLREVIKSEESVKAMAVEPDCDCYVTQQDIEKTFKDGFIAIVNALKEPQQPEETKVSAMQAMVGERVTASTDNKDTIGAILWTAIAGLVALLTYVLVVM